MSAFNRPLLSPLESCLYDPFRSPANTPSNGTAFADAKLLTIPIAQQAGAVSGGVYPILLGDLPGIAVHGRDLVIKDSGGAVIPHCRLERRHIAALDGAWIFYGAPYVIFDPDASTEGEIYLGVVTTAGHRNLVAYNVATGAYTLYQFSSENLQNDDHNQPALAINGDGKLVVAYTEHSGTMKVRVANNAHDLSGGFTSTVNPANGAGSYATLFYLSSTDTLYLWHRRTSDSSWDMSTSTDGGATWSTFSQAIKTNTVNNYNVFWSNDVDVVWMAGNECKPNGTEPYNRAIYCYQFDGTNYLRPDGTTIGTTIPNRSAITGSSILFSQTADVIKRSVIDIMAGADGNPRILYYVYPGGDEATNHELWHARWTGTEWLHHKVVDEGPAWVGTPSESYPGAAQFCRCDINEISTCVATSTGKKEVQIFRTTDNGASWTKSVDVTVDSIEHNTRPRYPHGMTTTLRNKAKTPHLFWMGNGTYPSFTSFKHCIKAYPADYAYGALIKVDLPGDEDVELTLEWGKSGYNGDETLELFNDLGMEFVNIGAMRFNDSHDSTNMVKYSASAWTRLWDFPRFINLVDDVWPSWRKNGTTAETLRFSPVLHGENIVSTLCTVRRTGTSGFNQHLVGNNVASPLAIAFIRMNSSNQLQSLVYQTSAFNTRTATVAVGTDWIVLAGVFQRNITNAIRYGETEQTQAASDQSINAAGSTGQGVVGQLRQNDGATNFSGPFFITMQGRAALTKAYTDSLQRAISNPAAFIEYAEIDDPEPPP